MDKTVYNLRDELVAKICKAINESNLHLLIVEPALSALLDSVRETIRDQNAKDRAEYEKWKEHQQLEKEKSEQEISLKEDDANEKTGD